MDFSLFGGRGTLGERSIGAALTDTHSAHKEHPPPRENLHEKEERVHISGSLT